MMIFRCSFILVYILFHSHSGWGHIEQLQDIEVVDHNEKQSLVDFIPSTTVIRGDELQKRRDTSLGEILKSEAGVSSTSFGPSSSRPVIRGLDGDRIRILQNGLGTLDASTQSLDHAVPVDTLTIDQIEVVRGPMSLLYGASAVGGVVNLTTNRIHTEFEEGLFSQTLIQGETVNPGMSSAVQMNYGINRWMLHLDASTRNLADQRIPSYLKGGPEEKKGVLPNSFNQQDNLAFGASHILSQGYFGASINHFASSYGSVADPEVSINMLQNRGEFHFEWNPDGGLFRKYKLKSTQSSYNHREIENKQTGTIFQNGGNETRFEAFNKNDLWDGVSGFQTQIFQFKASGDEAFLPTTENTKLALFSFQERNLNQKNAISFGGRTETVSIDKKSSTQFGGKDLKNYTSLNGSIGHQFKWNDSQSISSTFSYTERAPNFQELYAFGDHLATASFEEGDSHLKKEKAYAFELSFKQKMKTGQFILNTYTQVFKDFISLNPTGLSGKSPEGLTEYSYQQVDALFYGADFELRNDLFQWNKGTVALFSTADIVRAKDTDSGYNLPRISPARMSFGLDYLKERWGSDIEIQHGFHQTKTAKDEKWTDSYYQANLGYQYKLLGEESSVSFFARVRNIFDAEVRNHVSMLKQIAPAPGRNFVIGLQAQM
jgi:iron complex outermembrane receptor protein